MSQPKYTGERLTARKENRIVNLLAEGEPIYRIARITHASKRTIYAIRERKSADIAQRKQMLQASFGRLAANGVDRLNEEMESGKIKGALLVPATGMAVDKLQMLSGDPMLTILHEHAHVHIDAMRDFNERYALLPKRSPPLPPVAQILDQGLETVETALTLETGLTQQTLQKGEIEPLRCA